MIGNSLIPNYEGEPTCSEVESKWANVLKKGDITPSQVLSGELVTAELRFARVFLGDVLMPTVGEVLIKNPYQNVKKGFCGVKNGIAKLDNGLLVVVSEIEGQEDAWLIRRQVNWDNLDNPMDTNLLKENFNKFLYPLGSHPIEI